MHAELRADHDNLTWSVERVVLGRVQGAPSLGGAGGASARAARCVTFEAREGGGGGAMGGLSPRRSSASNAVDLPISPHISLYLPISQPAAEQHLQRGERRPWLGVGVGLALALTLTLTRTRPRTRTLLPSPWLDP